MSTIRAPSTRRGAGPPGPVTQNIPDAFWFDSEPFASSFVISFPVNGLYKVYGTLLDYQMIGYEDPLGRECDSYLTSAVLYVKVTQGNAIEITEKQFEHALLKDQKEKNEGRALGRVRQELEYISSGLSEFAVEIGEYADRYAIVENDLGLEIIADNGDLHQKYFEEQSMVICPPQICKWRIPFCRKYVMHNLLNVPITVSAIIKYENPTVCNITGICATLPVRNHLVYLAVRVYVYAKGYDCYGLPEGIIAPTIKTLLYPFWTDENGQINGTIFAAPPWDQGLPYVEFVDARSAKVDAVSLSEEGNDYTYHYDITPFGIKEPNSIFLPSICLMQDDTAINCYSQSFDPATLTLSLDVTYKEIFEHRTFFFNWEKNLGTVAEKWGSWAVGDTCLPLRAGWVENWADVCSTHGECRSYWVRNILSIRGRCRL